jgi:hypothetical protein
MRTASPSNRNTSVTKQGRRVRPCFVFGMALLLVAAGVQARPATPARGGGRMMLPAGLACEASHVTSWFGVVSGYRRERSRTWIRIDTDYGTVESTTIEHAGQADASAHYRYQGRAFTAKDFARIERKPGVLRPGVRATAWVCDDGKTPPLVDWQAAAE